MRPMIFKRFLLCLFIITTTAFAQTPNRIQPYTYSHYQKLYKSNYNTTTRTHTALHPYFLDDSLTYRLQDSILSYGVDTSRTKFIYRKLFNEHLIEVKKEDYTAYADFLPDFTFGRDFTNSKNLWLNTRGFQIGGTVGDKFSFYTSGYENQAVFPDYLQRYIDYNEIVPGMAFDRSFGKPVKDWSYVSANISYTPVKYLNIQLGQDKTFIGDGYRSLLLSDFASNYPFLKLTANLGNVQYMSMWSYMSDPRANRFSYDTGYRKKWGIFHYLDWNINNRLSLGFFDAIILSDRDDQGNKRGFDFSYISPIVFLRPVEASNGSPDNALIGFNAKYELLKWLTVYGQFSLDEFEARNFFANEGSSRNKFGYQIGLKGFNLLKIENLNFIGEFNSVRPFTYTGRIPIINYAHFNEPLAHPMGANFNELLGILSYSWKRFDFDQQLVYAHYGLDGDGFINYGKDIYRSYLYPAQLKGNFIGQGITTNLYFSNTRASFLLNPKYNLRLETELTLRRESNAQAIRNNSIISFGLRSSFRNIYKDF